MHIHKQLPQIYSLPPNTRGVGGGKLPRAASRRGGTPDISRLLGAAKFQFAPGSDNPRYAATYPFSFWEERERPFSPLPKMSDYVVLRLYLFGPILHSKCMIGYCFIWCCSDQKADAITALACRSVTSHFFVMVVSKKFAIGL